MWIYESHIGGLYATDGQQSYEELYCEDCGDADREIGEAETRAEAKALLKSFYGDEDYAGSREAMRGFLNREFGKGTYRLLDVMRHTRVEQDDDEFLAIAVNRDRAEELGSFATRKEALDCVKAYEASVVKTAEMFHAGVSGIADIVIAECGAGQLETQLGDVLAELETLIQGRNIYPAEKEE